VPGSTGRQAQTPSEKMKDAEGRSESAQMFEEGVTEAEHEFTIVQWRIRAIAAGSESELG